MDSLTTFCAAANARVRQVEVRYEAGSEAFWFSMNPRPRACFNPELLAELRYLQDGLEEVCRQEGAPPLHYVVAASSLPGVFNLGGDLQLFLDCARSRDAEGLRRYALACIDVVHRHAAGYRLPLTTVSLVQGDALGGGFEAALASQVIIAEEQARFGLPEVLFNLFPGMGAYSFLSRRLDAARAERMILEGRTYSAAEMHELGIVDVLTPTGAGQEALHDFLSRHSRFRNARCAVQRIREVLRPLPYEELRLVAEIWVKAALSLENRDLRLMERLVRAQNQLPNGPVRSVP